MPHTPEPDAGQNRRRFLRNALGVAGAGLTALVVTSAPAQAAGMRCCKDSSCPGCAGSPVRYRCHDYCSGRSFCICHSDVGACFDTGCA